VNAPVGDSTALQIGGFYRDEPGFIDTVNGKEDVNSYSSKGGRFAFNWLINDDWKVQASAFTHRIDADGTQTVDVDAHTLKPLYDEYVQNARVDQPSETELDLYNLTVKAASASSTWSPPPRTRPSTRARPRTPPTSTACSWAPYSTSRTSARTSRRRPRPSAGRRRSASTRARWTDASPTSSAATTRTRTTSTASPRSNRSTP
jgi:hypothetical protein